MPPSSGCKPSVASTEPIFADDAATAELPRLFDLLNDGIEELRSQQIIGPINHGQHGNIAALLARNQCILGHDVPPLFSTPRCVPVIAINLSHDLQFASYCCGRPQVIEL